MKKICVLLMMLFMLVCGIRAFAEQSDETASFTFFNGVQWGMTSEEVASCEGKDADNTYGMREHLTESDYDDQQVSKYTATRSYLFADDSLFVVCYYRFSSNEKNDYMYLQGALTSLYGESLPLLPEKVYDFFSDLSGEQSTFTFSDCIEWQVNGDTKIWLFMVDSKKIYLMYISDSFDPSQIGVYDTTGL